MISTQDSLLASSEPPLPPGFKTIEDIQNLPSGDIRAKVQVNVIGFLEDFRKPFQSNGSGMSLTSIQKSHESNINRLQMHAQIEGPFNRLQCFRNGGRYFLATKIHAEDIKIRRCRSDPRRKSKSVRDNLFKLVSCFCRSKCMPEQYN